MELKVWVDGIKRVVCGVTDQTSCQDIVIALAQAMGRTGRFTLIEKWRENERPLAPGDCPLLVLQKWGEFANEVKFILYESGTRRKHKLAEKDKTLKKEENQFTHNFTPPIKTSEAVIRRSLTFSGVQKPDSINQRKPDHNHGQGPILLPDKLSHNKILSDGNSWSSSSSISSQNSSLIPQFPVSSSSLHPAHRRVGSSSRERNQYQTNHLQPQQHPSQHSQQAYQSGNQGFPQKHYPLKGVGSDRGQIGPHTKPMPFNNQTNQPPPYGAHRNYLGKPVLNGPQSKPSAFLPVRPRRNSSESEQDVQNVPNVDIPIFTKSAKSSHKSEMEEYDLDTNFPDVVRETGRDLLIEEYHVPGRQGEGVPHGNQMSWEEQERVKLLRLVTMQSERIKMQDTQLDIIDTGNFLSDNC